MAGEEVAEEGEGERREEEEEEEEEEEGVEVVWFVTDGTWSDSNSVRRPDTQVPRTIKPAPHHSFVVETLFKNRLDRRRTSGMPKRFNNV